MARKKSSAGIGTNPVPNGMSSRKMKRKKPINLDYIKKNLRVTKVFGIFTPTMVFSMGIAGMISLWMGGKAVIAEEISLGSFVAFNGYLMLLSWPMMGIGYVLE